MGTNDAGETLTTDLSPEELVEQLEALKKERDEIKTAKDQSYQEAQKLNWIVKIGKDKTEFLKLYESDHKMADAVVAYNNNLYDEDFTAKDYLEMLKKEDKKEEKGELTEEDLLNKVEERLQAKEAKEVYNKLFKDKKIDVNSDFGKDVVEIYDDLSEGKKKTSVNVKKYFDLAFREAKRTSEFAEAYEKIVGDLQGVGSPKARGDDTIIRKRTEPKRAEIFDYLKKK